MHSITLRHSPRSLSRSFLFALNLFALLGVLTIGSLPAAAQKTSGGFSGPAGERNQTHQGGFTGPGPDLVTVAQASSMSDDARVAIKGSIVKSLGGEHYLFQDGTGSIEVEIDHDIWRGLQVGPNDVVIIYGEVEKEWMHREIDVKRIETLSR